MTSSHNSKDGKPQVKVVSFGFKKNEMPEANLMLDVRFLKNPYWVEELRPLTGLDQAVKDYVMDQDHAKEFITNLLRLIELVVPAMLATKTHSVTIAIGCTGGQHRSVAVAEALSSQLKVDYPDYHVSVFHRELDRERQAAAAASGEKHMAAEGGPK